jgi:aerobic carbon-monoxide dehydrogenase medium subunit
VIPAPFEYVRADSVGHAIDLLTEREDAKVLAGGQSLLPLMRLRLARPSTLVDVGRIGGLDAVRVEGDELAIGALVRHHDLATSALVQEACPILAYAASTVGDPAIRHLGTLGGSCAHADPAADLPGVLVALGATLVVRGPGGTERAVPAAGFFHGLFEPDLAPNEVLTEIRVPRTNGRGWSYLKFHRRAQDWALVAVAVVERPDAAPAVALVNMADRPVRAEGVEAALAEGSTPGAAAERADEGTSPPSDHAASGDYRRSLARVLVRRALEEALGR